MGDKKANIKFACFFHLTNKMKKKGQLKLSFGMIFSIILIIFFLVFAFFGIKKFLDIQEAISTEQFKSDLKQDLTRMWKSSRVSTEKAYNLPKGITGVCFENDEYENMYFVPREFGGALIEHIDFEKTLDIKINSEVSDRRLCFDNVNKKVKMSFEKDFGEPLVTILKNE